MVKGHSECLRQMSQTLSWKRDWQLKCRAARDGLPEMVRAEPDLDE